MRKLSCIPFLLLIILFGACKKDEVGSSQPVEQINYKEKLAALRQSNEKGGVAINARLSKDTIPQIVVSKNFKTDKEAYEYLTGLLASEDVPIVQTDNLPANTVDQTTSVDFETPHTLYVSTISVTKSVDGSAGTGIGVLEYSLRVRTAPGYSIERQVLEHVVYDSYLGYTGLGEISHIFIDPVVKPDGPTSKKGKINAIMALKVSIGASPPFTFLVSAKGTYSFDDQYTPGTLVVTTSVTIKST